MNRKPFSLSRYQAKNLMPYIYHDVHHKWKDNIASIYFGEPLKIDDPTVYHRGYSYGKCKLYVYNIFHRQDWSYHPILPYRRANSHEFDWEGFGNDWFDWDDWHVLRKAGRKLSHRLFAKNPIKYAELAQRYRFVDLGL